MNCEAVGNNNEIALRIDTEIGDLLVSAQPFYPISILIKGAARPLQAFNCDLLPLRLDFTNCFWETDMRFRLCGQLLCALFLLTLTTNLSAFADVDSSNLSKIKLPAGFKIETFCAQVPFARSMTLSPSGVLYVGTRQEKGSVYAVTDKNKDGKSDEVNVIAKNLFMPNGVAYRNGALFVGEVNRVIRFDDIEKNLKTPPNPVVVNDTFSRETHHGWKFIKFGPDDMLYVPVGAPCNICEPSDNRFETIMRMKPDGTGLEVYAKGVRNSVGFDWDQHKHLWFTDNGRDYLGDDLPPDELNFAPKQGMHFGFPYRYGNNNPDPEFGSKSNRTDFTPPAMPLGAHVASLGMRFYTGKMFPSEYKNQIFIAEHGSWNRSKKSGYRITLVRLKNGKAVSYEPFATGWMDNEKSWGRPVDLEVMPDGALLVSDDQAGAIYRISYGK